MDGGGMDLREARIPLDRDERWKVWGRREPLGESSDETHLDADWIAGFGEIGGKPH